MIRLSPASKNTVGFLWEKGEGRPAGFDYLRIALASAVILIHSFSLSYGPEAGDKLAFGPLRPLVCFVLPSFFALSGFLVAGSLLRNDLISFGLLRIIRIFPALTVEVIISALILGPLFTTVPLIVYFSSPVFHAYFFNVLGYIHFFLPGVFTSLPLPNYVNYQLWTVPFELECYVTLAVLALLGLHRRPIVFLIIALMVTIMLALNEWHAGHHHHLTQIFSGHILVMSFVFGVIFYIYRDTTLVTLPFALISLIIYSFLVEYSFLNESQIAKFFTPPFVAYITIAIGLWNGRVNWLVDISNYSYGIYLYGFPVQQAVSSVFSNQRLWWFNFCLSLPITFVLAYLSWHGLEVKFANRKKTILAAVHGILNNKAPLSALAGSHRT